MRTTLSKSPRHQGVALIIVMWIIMVLSLLIGGFAFTMHVETKVAGYSQRELKAEMLARSGVEVARMELLLHDKSPTDAGFDALTQEWSTNEDLYVNHELGEGMYNVTVTDEERKLPINQMDADQLHKLMDVLQIDPSDGDVIVDSILDWRESGDLHRLNGAKSDYYTQLDPPYNCKNAPFTRIEELLLVRGVTKEIYEGAPATKDDPGRPGLKDLLTVWSAGQVNVNTASSEALQALLGADATQIAGVLTHRDGADGIAGDDDDAPFRSPAEFMGIVGNINADPKVAQQVQKLINVSSQFFLIKSVGQIGNTKYTVEAVLRRQGGQCMVTSWTERRGG